MPEQNPKNIYREETRPTPTFRWTFVGFLTIHAFFMISAASSGAFLGGRIPGTPVPWMVPLELAIVGWLWLIFWNIRQVVEIGSKGISLWAGPFGIMGSYIPLKEITGVSVRPVGWQERWHQGQRWGWKRKSFYLSGEWMVELGQENGWTLAIGTNDPDGLRQAIRERMPVA